MAVLQGNGPSSQVVFELIGDHLTIGRKPENDITIDWDKAVSRRHAELELVAESWFVTDLDSANGTFVNGAKVDRKRALRVGDELRIGDTCLWLHGMTSSEPLSDTAVSAKPPELSRKQTEVLRELCRPQARDPRSPCATTKGIAGRMFVGEAAVKAHLSALYLKFDIPEIGQQRRAMLAKKAWDTGAVRGTDFDDDDRSD
jgi:pSer/pThr/pTyr-binding forkhead associated (FHA) protein